jgi:hypothetical protein
LAEWLSIAEKNLTPIQGKTLSLLFKEIRMLTDFEKATVYAAYKELEKILEDNGELPPGASFDVSGQTVNITLQPGVIVSRAAGENGDGIRPTAPSTNFYGWAPLAIAIVTLEKFKQFNRVIRDNLVVAIANALRDGRTTEEKLFEINPGLREKITGMKEEILQQLEKRMEPTRRTIKRTSKLSPILNFFKKAA